MFDHEKKGKKWIEKDEYVYLYSVYVYGISVNKALKPKELHVIRYLHIQSMHIKIVCRVFIIIQYSAWIVQGVSVY